MRLVLQDRPVERRGLGVGVGERGAGEAAGLVGLSAVRGVPRCQLDVAPLGEVFEGLAEVHAVVLLDEAEDVAAGAADEAVKDLLAGHDRHGGVVVLVEWAEADVLAALGLERDVLADDAHDVRRFADPLDIGHV